VTKYVLMTGATGLVGRYLVRDLLLDGHRLALVIRQSGKQTVRERVEQILQTWENELGNSLPRPVVLGGDVCEDGLGLNRTERQWVESHCDTVLHNAASLTFHGADRSADPWRTNLTGTLNLKNFCEQIGIRKVHYVSTAYVCGSRDGRIMESELDCGQEFRNEYEQSKMLAEIAMRETRIFDSLTVYRPAVIAGDSRTGYTSTYHGLYMYLQLMAVLNRNTEPDEHGVRHTNIRLNMSGDEPRNIVPVDWVASVIAHLLAREESHGLTYHLSPIDPITPRQIIEAGYRFFNSCGVEFCGPEHDADDAISRAERATYDNKTMYEAYEHSDPEFDTTNLQRMAPDLPCPRIDEAMLHRFLKFGEEDRWGRRKPAEPSIPGWGDAEITSLAREIVGSFLATHGEPRRQILSLGFNLTGPGGGQWTFTRDKSGDVIVESGLPDGDDPVLNCDSVRFFQFAEQRRKSATVPQAELFEFTQLTR